jgi:hypothetical protein
MPAKSADLAAKLSAQRAQIESQAIEAITGLRSVAERLALKDTAGALGEVAGGLRSDSFNMMVVGRFKSGKSTLMNALMAGTTSPVNLDGAQGLMVVDDLPATAVLSAVTFAEEPSVRVWKTDRKWEAWSLGRYLRESTLGDDEEENTRRFQDIAQFEIGFPARLCRSKVTLYDSPGTGEHAARNAVIRAAIKRCDTALIVYNTQAPFSQEELDLDASVRAAGTRVFVVINRFHGRPVDDRLCKFVWNRYLRDYRQLNVGEWTGQDLGDYDIYFVDAKAASDGRYTGDENAYQSSGLAVLEERLGRFLIDDRLRTHLEKYTTAAVNLSDGISQQVTQRQAAIGADRERLRAAWEAEQPKLAALRSRPERLPKIIDRYRGEAAIELSASFKELVASIRADLPAHLEAARLPTGEEKLLKVYHQKRLMSEATGEIQSFMDKRVAEWSNGTANEYMTDLMNRLNAEISDEVAQIGRQFDSINVALTGWDRVEFGNPGAVIGTRERVASAVAGFLVGDMVGAFTGGAGGWRGAAGSFVGAVGASAVLVGVLGVSTAGAAIPVMAAAWLVGAAFSGINLVPRTKKKALEMADTVLTQLPAETSAKFDADLKERFGELGKAVTAEVELFIDEQVRNLETQIQLNEQGQAEKDRILTELAGADAEIARHKDALKRAITLAKQG